VCGHENWAALGCNKFNPLYLTRKTPNLIDI
jgi:hypothetical protein